MSMRGLPKMSQAVLRMNSCAGIPEIDDLIEEAAKDAEPTVLEQLRAGTICELPADRRAEKELQRDCENWLRLRGYYPRTPAHIIAGMDGQQGYYIHLNRTKKNPILLDLLILRADGMWLEVELKVEAGRLTPVQNALIESSKHRVVCRSLEQMKASVELFELAGEKRKLSQTQSEVA